MGLKLVQGAGEIPCSICNGNLIYKLGDHKFEVPLVGVSKSIVFEEQCITTGGSPIIFKLINEEYVIVGRKNSVISLYSSKTSALVINLPTKCPPVICEHSRLFVGSFSDGIRRLKAFEIWNGDGAMFYVEDGLLTVNYNKGVNDSCLGIRKGDRICASAEVKPEVATRIYLMQNDLVCRELGPNVLSSLKGTIGFGGKV